MSPTKTLVSMAAFLLSCFCNAQIDAPNSMVPPGLSNGDTFYIIFTTSTTITATDGNAATYNAHVNTAADLSGLKGTDDPSLNWSALVATLNDGAQSTSLFSGDPSRPIFNLNGDKVADNSADMFDGSLDNGVSFSESGANVCGANSEVWSGMDNAGVAFATRRLGELNVLRGVCSSASGTWNFAASPAGTESLKVYAVSPLLRVNAPPQTAQAVPSMPPLTLALLATILAGLAYKRLNKTATIKL